MMKKILIALLIAMLVFLSYWNTYAEEQLFCLNCGEVVTSNYCPECGQSSTTSLPDPASDETYLSLKVSYEKNKILARYDIDVSLDGESLGTISQSEDMLKLLVVKKGIHEVTVSKNGKHEVSILVDASSKSQVACTVKAHMFSLELKDVTNSSPVSAEAEMTYMLAKYASESMPVDYESFCRYPEEYTGQKMILNGRVVATAENFAGVMRVVVKDGRSNLWIVEYKRPKSSPRLLVNDDVKIYGVYKGITDYTSSVEVRPHLPTVTLEYLQLD